MTKRFILFIGLTMVLITPAFAQFAGKYDRSGAYLGVGGFYAIEDFDTSGGVKADNAAGFNFRLGYRFTPRIAIEAMGERIDNFDIKRSVARSVKIWTGTVNGKFFLLADDKVQPYVLAGLGFVRGNQDNQSGFGSGATDTDFALRYGGGADVYMVKNWLVNLEISYVHPPTGDTKVLNYLTLGGGIQYRF